MTLFKRLVLIGLFGTFSVAQAQAPVFQYDDTGTYIQDWLLCGPFPNPAEEPYPVSTHLPRYGEDFLESIGGEQQPDISEGTTVTVDGKTLTWTRYRSDTPRVNLDKGISDAFPVVGYAYCEIESDQKRGAVLALGSNDGGSAWFNGEPVWDLQHGGALQLDRYLVPVVLKKGKNSLLLKIEERGNTWEFSTRFFPLDHPGLLSRLQVFRVSTDEEGGASVVFKGSANNMAAVMEDANFTLVERNDSGQVVWKGKWQGESKIPIDVNPNRYAEYSLQIQAKFSGGGVQQYAVPIEIGKRVDHVLFANEKSPYAIVIGNDASDSERWAANELSNALKEIGGSYIPVRQIGTHPVEQSILLGTTPQAMRLLGERALNFEDTDEGFQYENAGSTIIIRGGKQRGTMYGVMDFLEQELGSRWYTPGVTKFTARNRFTFNYLNRQDSPGIRVRNDFYHEAFNPIWAAHNRVNGSMNHREQPGDAEGYWAVHTFNRFLPPSEFFDTHPEYYSLVNGERTAYKSQLCLTNPDVLKIVIDRLRKVMRDNPQNLIYSVSQNDWAGYCECDDCQAVAAAEKSEAGVMVHFVNAVADAVKDEFPDKFVGTLAYQYTRKPPKHVKPRENVVIRLCSIECCFAHSFNDCPENKAFIDDIEDWAEIAPHIYIWDYVVSFSHYLQPYPNFSVLQDNIRTFQKNNAIGIMEQGAYQSRGGELAELRMYVLSKLLWNPDCDVDAVVNDFIYGYYGRSGQYIREYFDLAQGLVKPDTHIYFSSTDPTDKLFSDDFVREAGVIFDRAEAVADDEATLRRVETARLSVMYLKCMRMPHEAKRDGTYDRFTAILQREGVAHFSEAGAPDIEAFHKRMAELTP